MATRARRLRWLDWTLVATLVPLFVVLLALQVREGLANGAPFGWIQIASAANPTGFPVVAAVFPAARFEGQPVLAGDHLLRIDDRSLEGAHSRDCWVPLHSALRSQGVARLEVARGDEHFETTVLPTPRPLWWASIPFSLGSVVIGSLLLLRAPHWSLRRRYFICALGVGIYFAADEGALEVVLPGAWYFAMAAWPIGVGAALSTYWDFNASARPLPVSVRAQPWLVGSAFLATQVAVSEFPLPIVSVASTTWLVLVVFSFLSIPAGLTRAYLRSDELERRQLRWVLYGLYLALLPVSVIQTARLLGALGESLPFVLALANLFAVAVPVGMLVAVLGYRFLDVDRLISATTSYTILGVILLGVALQVIPRVAEAAGPAVGLTPATGQWALTIAMAATGVQAHRWLRPWLDRRLFAERVAVEDGLARLVRELGACGSAEELTRVSGEQIDTLLRPDSISVYAREGAAFTPVFVRGRTVLPAFASDSVLVHTLERSAAPLVAATARLDPFDAAALATLGVEVVIPTRRGEALVAFTCLGRKRSGDVYTPAELALLTAVASASGEVLQRLGAGEVAEQARAMQASLRRYVPGAIAEQLEGGRDLQAGEREVTVLFVDLRGYTTYAEKRPVEDVFSTVNEHTERTSEIVRRRGGAVVEFNGDGMMAVFGAPEALAEKERHAIEAAREIVDSAPPDLPVGIGIATGLAYAGNIRAADRWIWSVIGDTTNLAARLQALTRELEASIATDAATRSAAGYVCADFTRHRDVPVRGRSQRVDVFALPLARAPRLGEEST